MLIEDVDPQKIGTINKT